MRFLFTLYEWWKFLMKACCLSQPRTNFSLLSSNLSRTSISLYYFVHRSNGWSANTCRLSISLTYLINKPNTQHTTLLYARNQWILTSIASRVFIYSSILFSFYFLLFHACVPQFCLIWTKTNYELLVNF